MNSTNQNASEERCCVTCGVALPSDAPEDNGPAWR